jgi:hypothetical protein
MVTTDSRRRRCGLLAADWTSGKAEAALNRKRCMPSEGAGRQACRLHEFLSPRVHPRAAARFAADGRGRQGGKAQGQRGGSKVALHNLDKNSTQDDEAESSWIVQETQRLSSGNTG